MKSKTKKLFHLKAIAVYLDLPIKTQCYPISKIRSIVKLKLNYLNLVKNKFKNELKITEIEEENVFDDINEIETPIAENKNTQPAKDLFFGI